MEEVFQFVDDEQKAVRFFTADAAAVCESSMITVANSKLRVP